MTTLHTSVLATVLGTDYGGNYKFRSADVYTLQKHLGVTLTTFLGCLSCISVTKKCYQIDFLKVH